MAIGKHSRNLSDHRRGNTRPATDLFDRSITLALLALIAVSWFINHFLVV